MATLLIGYDLDAPGQDYKPLYAAIKALGDGWWHHLDSTWIVTTSLTVTQARDRLLKHIDTNDKLLVTDITADAAAWYGFNSKGSQWLKDNI
jgi:hypothetical protein